MLRRILATAGLTARDLFAGRGALLIVLACCALLLVDSRTLGASGGDERAVALRHRLQTFAALAAAAALFAGAHAIHDDRRTRRLEQWSRTPMRAGEAFAGRVLGTAAGLAAAAIPLLLALLLIPEGGLLRQREQFAPRERFAPAAVERVDPDGRRFSWRRGPALLEAGASLELRFDEAPPGACTLRVIAHELEIEPAAAPLRLELREGDVALARVDGGLDGRLEVALSRGVAGPRTFRLLVSEGEGTLRVDPAECALVGPAGPIVGPVARAAIGIVALLLFAAALGGAFAALLPDYLAICAGGTLLALAALRPLLREARVALDDPHSAVALSTRAAIAALARVVDLLPDVARAVAAEPIATASSAFAAPDAVAIAAIAAWCVVAAAGASVALARIGTPRR